jgi:hypothetical protein
MSDTTLESYVGKLVPAQYDKSEASTRRSKVEDTLRQSSLRVTSVFESGSWSHGTAITAKSDVDYMAVATSSRPMYPSSGLATAKAAIKGSDWKISDVGVSSPVVQIRYYTPPHFEIAPAWFKETKSGYQVFWIAGRGDEWVLSAPAAHLAYVNTQNDRLSKRVKPLVRLLKAWKYNVGAPVSSFYVEMRAAHYASGESSIVYDIDLRECFRQMINVDLCDMNDPKGIAGRIPACSSDEKRRRTKRLTEAALTNLERADAAKARGARTDYWGAMYDVFGSDYPWPTW